MSTTNELPPGFTETNHDREMAWSIDVQADPYAIDIDLLNPAHNELFRANKVLPYFARLRAESPIHYCADSQFGPYWSITKFDDIKSVEQNHQVFSSDIDNGGIRIGGRPTEGMDLGLFHLPMFIMQDPPKHSNQRKVIAPMFTPGRLAEFEHIIRARAGQILDKLPRGESFNWVREVSVELTGRMLATLFGVSQDDRQLLIHWSDTVERITDSDYFATPEEGFKELWKCFEYFDAIRRERTEKKSTSTSDLISFLLQGDATKDMPPNEFLGNILLLIVAGNDTTRNSISGGILACNQFPDQLIRVREKPSLLTNMVAEVIRWQTPVAHMSRTAMQDVEIRGKTIRKWDKVVLWYASGNRDEEHFEDADRFQIERKNARAHLAFGYGIHRCVGSRLAEMQLQILWEEILKRFSRIEVTGQPKYLNSNFIRGITDLPVTLYE